MNNIGEIMIVILSQQIENSVFTLRISFNLYIGKAGKNLISR